VNLQQLTNIDWVFFDIFDTVIGRAVPAEYVKRLAAKRLCLYLGLVSLPETIYRMRSTIEREICESNARAGFDLEFTFPSLCRILHERLSVLEPSRLRKIPVDGFVSIASDLELETEVGVQQLNYQCVDVIRAVRDTSVKLGLISDFYMPGQIVRSMLEHHGLSSQFDKVFVSCDYLLTKRSGRLYEKVLESLNCSPTRVMMIGNDQHSDYDVARSMGMHACLFVPTSRTPGADLIPALLDKHALMQKLHRDTQRSSTDSCTDYVELAFSLFHFIQKLHARLLSRRVRDVFFISKEGDCLKRMFDLYQLSQGFGPHLYVRSHHLQVSRRSTFLPSLKQLPDEVFETLFRQYRSMSLREFLLSLGLDARVIGNMSSNLNVDPDLKFEDFPTSSAFRALLALEDFRSTYEQRRIVQRTLFKRYLSSFGANMDSHDIHVVDVGWKGTIQDHIFAISDGTRNLHGYYIGLVAQGKMERHNEKEGILFSCVPSKSPYFEVYNEGRTMFEVFLGSNQGSAISYTEGEGQIKVVTHQEPDERELFENSVRPIQVRFERVLAGLCEAFAKTHFYPSELDDLFARIHARLAFLPARREIDTFRKMYHHENFGVFTVTRFTEEESSSLVDRCRNFAFLARHRRLPVKYSWWVPVTLTNMGLAPVRHIYGHLRIRSIFKDGK
jgi:FMN phosphatase YigB (HAD superfamily)